MNGVVDTLRSTLTPDIGIDVGTANTVIYERDAGTLISEPSVVAYDTKTGEIIACGQAAKEMDGRGGDRIRVVHPLRGGAISDFKAAHTLVSTVLNRGLSRRARLVPRVIASVPGCATDIECKAVEEALRSAGARNPAFVQQAVAAAVGAGLDITSPRAAMIVDIGGGTTEIAVLALSGVVALRSLKVGGDSFDRAIAARLRAERFIIGPLSAEALKIGLSFAGRPAGRDPMTISGFDLYASAPRRREVSEALVGEAMAEQIGQIVAGMRSVLESTPPDLVADLIESGVTVTGGGALISGLAASLGEQTRIPCMIAEEPLLSVARGAADILASPTLLERLRPSADKLTRWYQSLRTGMSESYSS